MSRNRTWLASVVVAAGLLAACGNSTESANDPNLSADANAGKAFFAKSCRGCHSLDGKGGSGPTMKGLAGSTVMLSNGTSVTADEQYLTTAIDNPDAQIVKGYNKGIMSSVYPPGALNEVQTRQLVAYVQTIK